MMMYDIGPLNQGCWAPKGSVSKDVMQHIARKRVVSKKVTQQGQIN